jgi:hypothetical protein
MRKRLLVSVFVLVVSQPSLAAEAAPAAMNRKMAEIGEVAVDLFPLIMTRRELNATEQTRLKQDLTRLVVLFREAGPHVRQRSQTYNVSYQLVLDHLEKTKRALDRKYVDRARVDLYALGPICTSCHTQDTKLRSAFAGAERARFPDDLSYAEFNFFSRNYVEAEEYYDKYLNSKAAKTEFDVVQPLQRIITLYAQVLNEPGKGAERLSRYFNVKGHTANTRKHLEGWIAGLRALEANGAAKASDTDMKALEGYMRRYIGPLDEPLTAVHVAPDQEIARVWLRGQLYHYLNRMPNMTEVPKILYWLAVVDRAVGYEYFFSLADLYLKDCVLNYSSDPYAQRCFDEYNEYVTYAYSGSAGTFIPPEIEDELEKMKAVLAGAKGAKQ